LDFCVFIGFFRLAVVAAKPRFGRLCQAEVRPRVFLFASCLNTTGQILPPWAGFVFFYSDLLGFSRIFESVSKPCLLPSILDLLSSTLGPIPAAPSRHTAAAPISAF
jgi:hypothetical protein